ncbi:hypothetical protein FOCC_FOCC005665 [Frankliniella occidentalis]|nr:hypothetical protein FOCC_FOCC005665 [Frankliniella occidentalis]
MTTLVRFIIHRVQKVDIDIYEARQIGGRLATVDVSGRNYETGGSIIHPRNKYMVSFVKNFGLKVRETSTGSRMGLWDGGKFVFEESSWEPITYLKMLWRYGYGIFKLKSYIDDMLTKFESIYLLQNKGEAFWTVSDLLKAMNPQFENDQRIKTGLGFKKLGFSDLLVDEIVAATIRVNYGQDLMVHKFVGSVSVAGATGDLWAVDGGNFRVAEKLLEASEAQLVRDRVVKVSTANNGKLIVRRQGTNVENDKSDLSRAYDIVVLAAPLQTNSDSSIDLSEYPDKGWPGPYHHTVSTVLQGKLNHSFFGYSEDEAMPDEILSTTGGLFFNSVSRIQPVDLTNKERISDVWKVFSPVPLSDSELDLLFIKYNKNSVKVNDWLAYPHYARPPSCNHFRIHKNFYYLNTIEWAASAMEMSVIGAKNIALLAHKNYFNEPVRAARHSKAVHGLEGKSDDEL